MKTKDIKTNIPIGYKVNSIVPGNTVMDMPNATAVEKNNVPIVNLSGAVVSGGYASPGNSIKVLEIFEGKILALVPIGNKISIDTKWVIGYFELKTLGTSIKINYNTISWYGSENKIVYDKEGNVMYSLPTNQVIQFLYETSDNKYACILFNGNNGELVTGYVEMKAGLFYRDNTPRVKELSEPKILKSLNINNNIIDMTAIYIASFEGFTPEPYFYGVGTYAHSIGYGSHYNSKNFPNIPITKEIGFQYLINYISNNINDWNKVIDTYISIDTLSIYQLVSLYDFIYNEGGGWLPALIQKIIENNSFINTFANWEEPKVLAYRRNQEWKTYTYNKFYLGNSVSSLPLKYLKIARVISV